MDSQLNGAFTFSKDEWLILAYGLGIRSINGFLQADAPPERECVIQAINSLIKKKFITPHGDSFEVLSPYRDAVFRTKANSTLYIRTRIDRLPDCVCYLGNPFLLSEPMPQNNAIYRFEFLEADALWKRLFSEGYFPPDVDMDELPDLDKAAELEESFLEPITQKKSLDAFSQVILWMGVSDFQKKDDRFLAVIEHPLYRYILTQNTDGRKRLIYSTTQLKEQFLRFVKEANV